MSRGSAGPVAVVAACVCCLFSAAPQARAAQFIFHTPTEGQTVCGEVRVRVEIQEGEGEELNDDDPPILEHRETNPDHTTGWGPRQRTTCSSTTTLRSCGRYGGTLGVRAAGAENGLTRSTTWRARSG